jgi:NAD+ synthase
LQKTIGLKKSAKDFQLRLGNIMARIRMTALYDLAKEHNGLVCGTENKSEFLLGYFTRHGDEASDFEPIRHLYKTQIYELGKHLNVPESIINLHPTAGLWDGQTDEGDFGFSYQEADLILNLYFDKKMALSKLTTKSYPNFKKIIQRINRGSFKHHSPYVIKPTKK